MQGLLDVYIRTGNQKAYTMVLNMADYVRIRMNKLTSTSIDQMLYTAQANPVNESGAMNEVLHHLFSISKDSAHFKLATIFDRRWLSEPLSQEKDILSGLHANTHLVLVNGFATRYAITGEDYYKNAAINFWQMLNDHHSYVNGSSSGPRPIANTPTSQTAEHWGVADRLSTTLTGEIAESCVTHNSQKLTASLFTWSRSAKYAESYMNRYYNAVLPSQSSVTGQTVYHLPLGSPQKKKFLKEDDFRCCNGTAVEAFTNLNANIYFHDDDNVWINLYEPSVLSWNEKKLVIEQTGNFIEDGKTAFSITSAKPQNLTISLFMPSWADHSTVILVNGKPLADSIEPLSFVPITRTWSNHDKIEIVFSYKFHVRTMLDDPNVIALFYGPVLLAFETENEVILKTNPREILEGLSMKSNELVFELKNNGRTFRLVPFFQINDQAYGVYATIRNEY